MKYVSLLAILVLALASCSVRTDRVHSGPLAPFFLTLTPESALQLLLETHSSEMVAEDLQRLTGVSWTRSDLESLRDSLTLRRVRSLVGTESLDLLRPPNVSDKQWTAAVNDARVFYSDLYIFPITHPSEGLVAWAWFNAGIMTGWSLDVHVNAHPDFELPAGYLVTRDGSTIEAANPFDVRVLDVFQSGMVVRSLDEDSIILEVAR